MGVFHKPTSIANRAKTIEELTAENAALAEELRALREADRLKDAKITALTDQNDFHEDLIVEMASVLYA